MTERKAFKSRVRARMSKTGESYTAARAHLDEKRRREAAARTRLTSSDDRMSDAKLKAATGKTWDRWFAILDRWGASKKKHPEIARYLGDEHGLPGWWAQNVTVGYERARGMRLKHQHADGFSVSASRTIAVPVARAFEAVVDDVERKKWLGDGSLSLRTSQRNKSARFDWEDGSTRVNIGFTAKGSGRSVVALEHSRLADADDAQSMKAMWKERLTELKSMLEA